MADCPASSAAAVGAFATLREHEPSAKKRRLAATKSAAAGQPLRCGDTEPQGPPVAAAAAAAAAARAATPERFSAILLGTGASNRVPRLDHILSQDCAVCASAMRTPESRDRRNNVSIALLCRGRTIMIDAGKTMYTACTQIFPRHGIKTVNAILLTHGHADAILGLDDVRELQKMERVLDADGNAIGFRLVGDQPLMPIITNQKTIDEVKRQFPYLAKPPTNVAGQPSGVMPRKVAALDFQPVADHTELVPNIPGGLRVCTFPVFHGATYISLGFAIGGPIKLSDTHSAWDTSSLDAVRPHYPLVYISDVKHMPASSKAMLLASTIGVFVVDALWRDLHFSHYSLDEALQLIRELRPAKSLIIGMTCEMGMHKDVNLELAALYDAEGLDVQLGYDGQVLADLPLLAEATSDDSGTAAVGN